MSGPHKYITKNEKSGVIGGKYHTRKDCVSTVELRLIMAPEALLRHYNITEKCKLCEAKDSKIVDKEEDLREHIPLLSNASIIMSKQISREVLRALCVEYSIPFTMRRTKLNLARLVCKHWIRNGMFDRIEDVTNKAQIHWQDRIDKKDRHRPHLYLEMRDRCDHILKLLNDREGVEVAYAEGS